MVVDEPAMWNLIPDRLKPKVDCVAKAMCSSRDADDDDLENHCGDCDTPTGGSCVAFALYGHAAIAAVEGLEKLERHKADESIARIAELTELLRECGEAISFEGEMERRQASRSTAPLWFKREHGNRAARWEALHEKITTTLAAVPMTEGE